MAVCGGDDMLIILVKLTLTFDNLSISAATTAVMQLASAPFQQQTGMTPLFTQANDSSSKYENGK